MLANYIIITLPINVVLQGSTGGVIIYTDIGPSMVNNAANQQNFILLCDDSVQYEEIRHNVEQTPGTLCKISGMQFNNTNFDV